MKLATRCSVVKRKYLSHKSCHQQKIVCHFTLIERILLSWYGNSLETHPLKLTLTAHGWTGNNQGLQIKWMSKKPAPDSLLESISCNCKS